MLSFIENPIRDFSNDDAGVVISAELVCVSTVLLVGMVVGFTSVRDATISELSDIAGAVQDSKQGYTFSTLQGHSSKTGGSSYADATDHCDEPEDPSGSIDNCIVFSPPTDEDEPGETIEFSVEAEGDGVTASTGGAYADGWNLWSEGTLSFTTEVPEDGTYKFNATLWASLGGPEIANAAFLVNGVAIDDFDVTPTSHATAEDYCVEVFLPAGSHTFAVEYTNDYYVPPIDRNLYIDSMSVQGPL